MKKLVTAALLSLSLLTFAGCIKTVHPVTPDPSSPSSTETSEEGGLPPYTPHWVNQ